jgi:hypothetical protein
MIAFEFAYLKTTGAVAIAGSLISDLGPVYEFL